MKTIFLTIFRITIVSGIGIASTLSPALSIAPPHGGQLVDRTLTPSEFEKKLSQSTKEFKLKLKAKEDLECISTGIYSPLEGFMNQKDYLNVVNDMRLSNGLVWPIPVALDVPSDFAKDLKPGQIITLKFNDQAIAVMQLEDVYTYDKKYEVKQIYNSESPEHPGVKLVENQGDHYIGGKVFVKQGAFDDGEFSKDNITPKAAREHFHKKGWETVVAFQTRNPLHRAHEHLLKTALESTDGLFLNPLVGSTKSDDVPPAVRMKTYKIMLDKYFNPDRVIFSTFPAAMRYAGPKEAILHAIARQNYGCTHMIVGRDHAGVGNFYGPYDAQLIFTHLKPDDLNIKVVKFENAFYCKSTGTMATLKTCPADSEKIELSGTKVRQILRDGGQLPEEISRQEVAAILSEHYKNHKEPK